MTVSDLSEGGGGLPPTDGVLLEGDRVRVVVRPSGTEPKLKCYLQVRVAPSADVPAARAEASEVMGRVRAEMGRALGL